MSARVFACRAIFFWARFYFCFVSNSYSNRAGSRTFRQKKNSGGDCGRNSSGTTSTAASGGGSGGVTVTTNANGVCILPPEATGTLGSGDLKQAVRLPTGEDLCEWVAVNSK